MRLTMRTILVLLLGAALSLVLYVAADSSFGSMIGPNGLNPNFSALISTWRALGGTAQPLGVGAGGGMGGGFGGGLGGGGLGGHSGLSDGLDLSRAPGQTGSDLLWIGIPALIGAAIEIDATYIRRKRKRAQARKKSSSATPANRAAKARATKARRVKQG
jgi:hypothetical protein